MPEVKLNPEGKIALISGSNRGIGKAIAIELLEKGAKKVYAGARNIDSLAELKETYGDRLVPIKLDVTDDQSIETAVAQVEDLDILVNNAGIFKVGGIFSDEAYNSLETNLDVNVWGLIKLSRGLVGQLKKSEPTAIINISSVAGLGNMPMAGTYSVSKAAVHSTTQGMRGELANDNVLVMGVYPGPIDTDMAKDLPMDKDTPQNVAKHIVVGLSNGQEDIFPDVMSAQIGEFYGSNPKGVEQQFGTFV